MIYFLFITILSIKNIETIGFHTFVVLNGEKVYFDLKNGTLSAYIFWTRSQISDAYLTTTNETDFLFNHNITDERTIKIMGKSAVFQLFDTSLLQIWVLPSNFCPFSSFVYSTDNFLADDFSPQKTLENHCLFFTHISDSIHLFVNIASKGQNKPYFRTLIPKADQIQQSFVCNNNSCHSDIVGPFFLEIYKLDSLSSFRMDYTLSFNDQIEQCNRQVLHGIHGKDHLINSILFKQSLLTCDSSESTHDEYLHIIIVSGILIISIVGLVVLYVTGCCYSLSGWCNSVGAEGIAPKKNEPSELLRDQLNDIAEEDQIEI